MTYPNVIGEKVICPELGCLNCEHAKPHKYMEVDSSCDGGGDHNCPACERVESSPHYHHWEDGTYYSHSHSRGKIPHGHHGSRYGLPKKW